MLNWQWKHQWRCGALALLMIWSTFLVSSKLSAAPPQADQAAPQTPSLPRPVDLRNVQAAGPLHEMAKLTFARNLPQHGGADWDNPDIPGDGTGRWMLALCRLGAYLHEKPQPMIDQIPRMLKMRNKNGFFGPEYDETVIRGGDWFDHNHVLNWALDYAKYYDKDFGLSFAKEFADASFMPREPYLQPAPRKPDSHWVSWGETGADFGALQGMAKLAIVTGDPAYARFVRAYADTGMEFKYEGGHAHATMAAMIGYIWAYEATGDRKYLDFATKIVDDVAMKNETGHGSLPDSLGTNLHSEGCGVADWLIVNLELGRVTGKAVYFDRAERVLWGPFFYQMNRRGGMGCGAFNTSVLTRAGGLGEDVPFCCSMHGPNALMRVFGFSTLADQKGVIVPLYYPFTSKTKLDGGKTVTLAMETAYPKDGEIRLRIEQTEADVPWRLRLRIPRWSTITDLKINGTAETAQAADGWLDLERLWKAGDEVSFKIPLPVWFNRPQSDDPITVPDFESGNAILKSVRVFRGPLLLGVDQVFNDDLNWANIKQEEAPRTIGLDWAQYPVPLTLYVPFTKKGFETVLARPEIPSEQEFMAPFVYPIAHFSVLAGPTLPADATTNLLHTLILNQKKVDQAELEPAILTPIAEKLPLTGDGAGRAEGPKVILFDVVLLRTPEGLKLLDEAQ